MTSGFPERDVVSTSQSAPVAGDVHSHVWAPAHLSDEFVADLRRAWPAAVDLDASYEAHATHAVGALRSVVLAFDAPYSGFCVPNEFVAEYVARDPERLVGFCSIDPARRNVEDVLKRATEELGLQGVKLAPTYQGFDPLSAEAFSLYEAIAQRKLPILWHQGVTFVRKSVLAYALPRHIDEVALRLPELRIVIAHLGHPWIDECIVVARKHPNVYADVSALYPRPRQFREALIRAGEYGCADKLLFGSDFPFGRIEPTVALLREWAGSDDAALCTTAAAVLRSRPLEVLDL